MMASWGTSDAGRGVGSCSLLFFCGAFSCIVCIVHLLRFV